MLPAMATVLPARSTSSAVSAVVVVLQVCERAREEIEFSQDGDAGGARLVQQRRHARILRRQARALQHQLLAFKLRGQQFTADERDRRPLGAQRFGTGRALT
jgi:hypothetical protein